MFDLFHAYMKVYYLHDDTWHKMHCVKVLRDYNKLLIIYLVDMFRPQHLWNMMMDLKCISTSAQNRNRSIDRYNEWYLSLHYNRISIWMLRVAWIFYWPNEFICPVRIIMKFVTFLKYSPYEMTFPENSAYFTLLTSIILVSTKHPSAFPIEISSQCIIT
jgi:hypothetical protein